MKEVRLSPAAEKDLDEIWNYSVANWGAEKAQKYVEVIRDTLSAIAAGTRSAKPVSVREGYFKSAVGSHIVFYRTKETALVVIRILHSRMDAERHL